MGSTPSMAQIPDVYLRFAEQLHDRDIVISFNWDCLLELALLSLGKTYTYDFQDDAGIKLCKLHGSINWRLGTPRRLDGAETMLDWKKLGFGHGINSLEIYETSDLLQEIFWGHFQPIGEVEPFLVLPGYGKAFDVRHNATLWYKPEFAFVTTHDVYIVGLSLAPDDFFIRSFFLSNLPFISSYTGVAGRHTYIINPDPRTAENYDFVLSKGHATHLCEPFSIEHINLMKSRTG